MNFLIWCSDVSKVGPLLAKGVTLTLLEPVMEPSCINLRGRVVLGLQLALKSMFHGYIATILGSQDGATDGARLMTEKVPRYVVGDCEDG